MLISQAFPSEFLKAGDLQDREVRVVMDHVELKDVGDETKPVLFFQGKEKGLVLNKTNSNNIAMIYGDDTDDWMGRELILYPTMVDYQGRSVPAIRVKVLSLRERAVDRIQPVEARHDRPRSNGVVPRQTIRSEINDEVPF